MNKSRMVTIAMTLVAFALLSRNRTTKKLLTGSSV